MNEIEQIKEILSRPNLRPDQRIKEIHTVLGTRPNKTGRKKQITDMREYRRTHALNRYYKLKDAGKCVQCGRKNERLPRIHCLACAAKNSPIVRRKLMRQRLETP